MNSIIEPLVQHIGNLSWRDMVEIVAFSSGIYLLQRWLAYDRKQPLLGYWYVYCLLWLSSYILHLSTITYGLFLCLPATIVGFVVVHQRTLQKNFVTFTNVIAAQKSADDWLDVLMKIALVAINNRVPLRFVIEHRDALETVLTASVALHVRFKKEVLDLLFESKTFNPEQLIWLTTQGELRGINAQWKDHADLADAAITLSHENQEKQDALFFTAMTDALVLQVDPITRTFEVIVRGKTLENSTAQNAYSYIKRHYQSSTFPSDQKGAVHVYRRIRQSSTEQSQP